MSHPNEIELGGVELTDESYEVARVWVTHNAGSSVWVDARVLEQPEAFGYLVADTIRHAAFAYASVWQIDQDEALQKIVDGVAEELREQFNQVTTIQDGSPS
jgi:hypothetical protein